MANKIAILGSNGTIGKILVHELAELNPYAISKKDCDLTNRSQVETFLREYKFDTVINCAAAGGKQTIKDFIQADLFSNLKMFQNLRSLSNLYGVLINIGSGAEFDINQNITMAKENMIDERLPTDSYGLSKNLISRQCRDMSNAITLRLFGCFHPNEPSFRLLRRFCDHKDHTFVINNNRMFSWISAIDFANIISQIIVDWKNYPLDINCAYSNPNDLYSFLTLYSNIHKLNKKIEIVNSQGLDYTCNSDLMYTSLNLKFGLESSIGQYK